MNQKFKLMSVIIGIMILANSRVNAQCDVASHNFSAGYYVGWNSANNLDFKLGSTPTTYLTLGTAGDLNLTTSAKAFQINGNNVLGHKGATTNIFVGVGAGAASGSSSGTNNTFIGNNAGTSNTYSGENVAVGTNALYSIAATNANGAYISGNVAIGFEALYSTDGSFGTFPNAKAIGNTGIGWKSLRSNTIGLNNTAVGMEACQSNIDGNYNVAIGFRALQNQSYNSGANYGWMSGNVAVGAEALRFTSSSNGVNGIYNCAVGHQAGQSNTTGTYNSFMGTGAGYANTSGNYNTVIGSNSCFYNQTGSNNTIFGFEAGKGPSIVSHSNNSFFGYQAGKGTTTGGSNVFMGYQTGYSNTEASPNIFIGYQTGYANTYAGNNVAIGHQALKTQSFGSVTWASRNVAIGDYSLFSNQPTLTTNGNYNTALGMNAGYANTTGSKNTFIGYGADNAGATTITNATAIGYNAIVTTSNSLVLGGTGSDGVYTGIGTTAPIMLLDVRSSGTSTGGYVGLANSNGTKYIGMYNGANTNDHQAIYWTSGQALKFGTSTSYSTAGWVEKARFTSAGYLGIGTTTPAGALDVNGSAYCTSGAWSSDSTKKKNIQDLSSDALSIINQLRPVTFEWKKIRDKGMEGTQMGFLAQDLEKILPSTVLTKQDSVATKASAGDSLGSVAKYDSVITMKYIKYNELFPVFVKGMQQQQKMIDSLIIMVAGLKGGSQQGMKYSGKDEQGRETMQMQSESTQQIVLANNSQPILYQNEPNPFDGSTVIRYFIPENLTGSTFVVFYDMYGKEVNKLELKERGFGKIEANTGNLAVGIYSYSIVVDGKAIDTKKMLKGK